MNRLFRRSRSTTDPSARGDSTAYWKQVPKVNLVPSRQIRLKRSHLVRLGLVLVIVVAGLLLQNLYRSRLNIDESAETLDARLSAVQRQVNSSKAQITGLREQIDQINAQRKLQEGPYQAVLDEKVDWDQALLALFQARADGVVFGNLLTSRSASVELKGSVDDTDSMVDFQNRLRNSASPLDLVKFTLSRKSNPGNPSDGKAAGEALQFSATIRVGK